MNSLAELEREWERNGCYGSVMERVERAKKWMPYYSYHAAKNGNSVFDADADPSRFIGEITERGILKTGDTLLDIGSGCGDHTLRLAKKCSHVTALEMNPTALDVMSRRAGTAGIGNISLVNAMWEHYEPAERFDVSFTSMCPAICNVEEILKMEAATGRTCCILTVRKGSFDRHRKAMMAELGLHPKGMVTDADTYRGILTAMGRSVETIDKTTHFFYDVPAEKFIEQYKIYFSIFEMPENEAEDYLERYVEQNGDNGVLHDETEMHLELLTWNVNRSLN